MGNAFRQILDAVDIETYVICESESDCREIIYDVLKEIGFKDISIVFLEHNGAGARVRARGYIYKPGDTYDWLRNDRKVDN
ncbi:MAG TPA: hypothetical protein GX526_02240 [Thermoanaerobacterales bacterium]|nr:hypothetical protein [Thermoanaerobacterales bacterium]